MIVVIRRRRVGAHGKPNLSAEVLTGKTLTSSTAAVKHNLIMVLQFHATLNIHKIFKLYMLSSRPGITVQKL
jgi:hypothetical protein